MNPTKKQFSLTGVSLNKVNSYQLGLHCDSKCADRNSMWLASKLCLAATSICAFAAFMFCFPARGFAPTAQSVSVDALPNWCASNHIRLFADRSADQHVQFVILVEKPLERGIFWRLHLDASYGTNQVGTVPLGDEMIGPEMWTLFGNKEQAGKTVQRFSFSLDRNAITNSVLSFVQAKKSVEVPSEPRSPVYLISVGDLYRCADSTVSKSSR